MKKSGAAEASSYPDLQKQLDQLLKVNKESVCPSCGHCPTCGRRNNQYYPYTSPYVYMGTGTLTPNIGEYKVYC